jgi:hypothetical protein
MCAMAKTASAPVQLRKGTKVVATADLRGVPEGTAGKVMMVTGLSWIRYWVRFDNGIQLGQISRDKLATPAELRDGTGPAAAASAGGGDGGAAAAGGGEDAGGGVATPSGTIVPQKLLDRSAAARARLAG